MATATKAPRDNTAFAEAHPDLAARFREEGLDWLNDYTAYDGRKIKEKWVRDENGTLVDKTAKYRAYQELEDAQEELDRLREQEANKNDSKTTGRANAQRD